MKKLVWIAAFAAAATVVPVQAKPMHHHPMMHHHMGMAHPDHVTVDGKDYKVCGANIQDDCVNPREAGLGFGNMPIDHYKPKN